MQMESKVVANDVFLREVCVFLREGKEVRIVPKGNSMLPFIRGGEDSVILKRKNTYSVGDIVLARMKDGNYVLHRLVSTDGENVVLMGDGNLSGYEKCCAADLEAYVVSITRKGKIRKCSCAAHVIAAKLWRLALPVRRYLLAVYRRLYR